MKHAIIVAHPNAASFTGAVAKAFGLALRERGHDIVDRDLYRMNFDPRLLASEIPEPRGFAPGPDVIAERELLKDVDVFAFFYPLWLNAPPAILKGYMERVFGYNFAYGRGKGGNEPLLGGRKMISFTSSGAPQEWMIKTHTWDALRTLFDEHFAAVCGLEVVDHVHFGNIVPGIREDVVARHLATVREAAVQHFDGSAT